MTQSASQPGARGKCPICSRPTDAKYRPFCSRRCADVDLSRWLRGSYAIPDAVESEDGDESAPPAAGSDKDGPGSAH
jgi:endogenous inhibitor of DNA gyrase (YacG/DUF329 family)